MKKAKKDHSYKYGGQNVLHVQWKVMFSHHLSSHSLFSPGTWGDSSFAIWSSSISTLSPQQKDTTDTARTSSAHKVTLQYTTERCVKQLNGQEICSAVCVHTDTLNHAAQGLLPFVLLKGSFTCRVEVGQCFHHHGKRKCTWWHRRPHLHYHTTKWESTTCGWCYLHKKSQWAWLMLKYIERKMIWQVTYVRFTDIFDS